jgi:Animal haem peroxidase
MWLVALAEAVDRTIGWDRLRVPLGVAALIGLRERLRERNLYDTETPAAVKQPLPPSKERGYRTSDGTYNDPESPRMGSAGTRFGRNVPMAGRTFPATVRGTIMHPNPRMVSRELLTRKTFQPVRGLNLLAAAWIQFMVRDWFLHGRGDMERPWRVELKGNDPWPGRTEGAMLIPRTPEDPTRTPEEEGMPPTHVNKATHWWDGSQIYGNSDEETRGIRSHQHGKLKVPPDGPPDEMISADPNTEKRAFDEPGFWVGFAMMITLFTREHNAICDRLREEYPDWSDDELFERARIINAALMAKIHTVEWTPAILGHPTLQVSLRSNWWGLAGERIHNLLGRLSNSEVISGIPGSPTDHFGVPYAMTEEFVAVYRMHPLIPDEFTFRSAETGEALQGLEKLELADVAGRNTFEITRRAPMRDLFYSFGIVHPGEITLHNYPRGLQNLTRPDNGELMDLATTDILRTRELGLPRYNEFRELLHRPPVRTFEELTDDPTWAEELRRVYEDDIDLVDLMVGLYAEPRPKGFGFSDTAFRIFILMASRRLNSDRFFTTDYTPEVYTQVGLDWIDDNDMSSVLLRHFPDLAPSLRNIKNAFFPWRP